MDESEVNSQRDALIVNVLIVCGIAILLIVLVVANLRRVAIAKSVELGIICVNLMYDFETPDDILVNQVALQSLLTEDEFTRLCIDEPNRTINAYYKFKFSPSKVNIVNCSIGYIEYTLENEYIDSDIHWVFLYDVNGNRLENIREYKVELAVNG